jgi:beta-aspartyl-peptidase (threonine type)
MAELQTKSDQGTDARLATVLVHGGAGKWERDPAQLAAAVRACEGAARAGHDALAAGGSALDAVEAAVRLLEDAPMLNAGRGSYPNSAGIVELDAMIMDGATLRVGAVAAVQRVRNAVGLARRVMTDTPHAILAGEGASAFADSIGFPRCANQDLLAALKSLTAPAGSDTVGAVAVDDAGNVAAATSTGGIPNKMPGRVGDSPIAGAGAYADNARGAVSATGDGEAFIKLVISKRVCDDMAAGMTAQAACEAAVRLIGERLDASGGLIAIDRAGRIGVAFNTQAMPWAWASAHGATRSGRTAQVDS